MVTVFRCIFNNGLIEARSTNALGSNNNILDMASNFGTDSSKGFQTVFYGSLWPRENRMKLK